MAIEDRHGTAIGYQVEVEHHQIEYTFSTAAAPAAAITTSNRNSSAKCCCGFVCFVVVFCIIGAAVDSASKSGGQTKLDTPEVEVYSMTVFPFNITASHITANWNVSFYFTNPNFDYKLCYENIEASVLYKEENMSSAVISPFCEEGYYSQNEVKAQIAASMANMSSSSDIDAIRADWSDGSIDFNVKVNAVVTIVPADSHKRNETKQMGVSCEEVEVRFSSNKTAGRTMGGSTKCQVTV